MTVHLLATVKNFQGVSTDTKPTVDADSSDTPKPLAPGTTFFETDTGYLWIFDGTTWNSLTTATIAALTLVQLTKVVANQGEMLESFQDMRLEIMANRLAVQEGLNEGNATQHDFRELAQTILDRAETEEP
ncbi:hypothetical protein AYO44_03800 [Planctomycetaceae bacterium SCGC AG-212-F19]|nr:hypothetical protein AYO44_03800 [Planctomycetaceae bacterium SCGC AG-212-F19]